MSTAVHGGGKGREQVRKEVHKEVDKSLRQREERYGQEVRHDTALEPLTIS
jgi:hypothetical protein